ncbi:MAG: lysophospholipid acyltransferase family protein [Myxococcota bacterium]
MNDPNGNPPPSLLDALAAAAGSEDADSGAFDPNNDQLDPEMLQILKWYLLPVTRYFRTEVHGAHLLPRDRGCLCISNHAIFGIDSAALLTQTYMQTGRMLRALGEHKLFKLPQVGQFFARFGVVDGNRDNAVRLLQAGEWAICYPGGTRDSFKEGYESYQLKWHNRMGYLRSALAADVPLVPIAGIGIDDAFVTLGRERLLGRALFGSSRYDLPIFVGLGVLPMPVKFTFYVDRPIDLRERYGLGPEHADAPARELLAVHTEIWSHTQKLIRNHLKRRVSRFF